MSTQTKQLTPHLILPYVLSQSLLSTFIWYCTNSLPIPSCLENTNFVILPFSKKLHSTSIDLNYLRPEGLILHNFNSTSDDFLEKLIPMYEPKVSVWFEDTSVMTINESEKEGKSKKKENVIKQKSSSNKGKLKKEKSSITISKKSSKSRQSRSESPSRNETVDSTAFRSTAPFKSLGMANLDIVPLLVGKCSVLILFGFNSSYGQCTGYWP